ncbi:MAG TPA: Wzz/FepE/Etk N-terminal domain-containing protein [Pyrinomonadaceae bacterium]|nr:Wzz/FepE/Etk N-terminal domain-containing protein [Pyrinomonadaceae bacterium]
MSKRVHNWNLRELATTLFRRKWLLLAPLMLIAGASVALAIFLPDRYQSRMKILVKNSRADAVITPEANGGTNGTGEITESQINSEIALLTSKDLLEQVVIQSGLDKTTPSSFGNEKLPPVERAAIQLEKDLEIEAAKKSAIIEVKYTGRSPEMTANVLQTLANLYLEKHLKLHSPPGAREFFQTQTNEYGEQLAQDEHNLADFQRRQDFVSLDQEKQLNLQRLGEVRARFLDAEGAVKDINDRIAKLQQQVESMPTRISTQNRALPNQYSLERLSTMLLELRNRRTQLLTKLRADDRLVKEVDQQIADTSSALEEAKKVNNVEQTTDVNPVRQSLEAELAKARLELVGQKARRDDLARQMSDYQARLDRLDGATTTNADLQRQLKTSEDNYQLYTKKKEEARIADEMDQNKITNVALAEKPLPRRTPFSPNRRLILGLGLFLALLLSFTIVLIAEVVRDTVHTPRELELATELPVIATFQFQPALAAPRGRTKIEV